MKKFIIIFVSILFLIAFLLLFVLGEGRFAELLRKGTEESNVALIVNDVPVTEREVEEYMREVSRDRSEENLSTGEIRRKAIERVIRGVIINDYFDENELTVSEEEIKERILLSVSNYPEAETEEEYFKIMKEQGISKEEIERRLATDIRASSFVEIIMEKEEIDKDSATEKMLNELRERREEAEIEILE